jgi:hypothetical protein
VSSQLDGLYLAEWQAGGYLSDLVEARVSSRSRRYGLLYRC